MTMLTRLTGVAAPIEGVNVDTDQIIPARFLKFDRDGGYGRFLFHDVRFDDQEQERPEFVLNMEPFRSARILVADENFGCGSSREGAVYALQDFGIRAVIAPRFGDIFYNNCLRNRLLPATVDAGITTVLRSLLRDSGDASLTVDLEAMHVSHALGLVAPFTLDPFWRHCLMQGMDEIGLALQYTAQIEAFERERLQSYPWLA